MSIFLVLELENDTDPNEFDVIEFSTSSEAYSFMDKNQYTGAYGISDAPSQDKAFDDYITYRNLLEEMAKTYGVQ